MNTIEQLKDSITKAKHLVVLTGAGVSAESGVPMPTLLPEVAAQQGAQVFHINPQPSAMRFANEQQIIGKAGLVLPELVE